LIGFFGKQMILLSALHEGYFFVSILAILLSVVSAFYYLKVIRVVHFDPAITPGVNEAQDGRIPTVISTTIAIITLLLIFFILNPTPLLNSAHLLTLSLFDT